MLKQRMKHGLLWIQNHTPTQVFITGKNAWKKNVTFTKILPLKVECHDKWLPRDTLSVQHGMRQSDVYSQLNLKETFSHTLRKHFARLFSLNVVDVDPEITHSRLLGLLPISSKDIAWLPSLTLIESLIAFWLWKDLLYFNLW